MKSFKSIKFTILILTGLVSAILLLESCSKTEIEPIFLSEKLSDYNIFQGEISELIPNSDYKLYELSSALFSDYSEKQRLIKLPEGTIMDATDNDLLDFPEGTIIVKTFYYFNDKRTPENGRNIIETRLLVLQDGDWKVGTYLWNEDQTEANLITSGLNTTVNWINQNGENKVISYHIPSNSECRTCHYSDDVVLPIGPKVRNLNFSVTRNGTSLNQLAYLQNERLLSEMNPEDYQSVPNYNDENISLDERARAYLDINCAHCHNENGFAFDQELRIDYTKSLEETEILNFKGKIVDDMMDGSMPKIGTTLVDEDGLKLMIDYINSLN